MIDFVVPEPWIQLIRNSSLKKACAELLAMTVIGVDQRGVDGGVFRIPDVIGSASPWIS